MALALALAAAGASVPPQALAAARVKATPSGRSMTIVGDRAGNEIAVRYVEASDAIQVLDRGALLGSFAAGPVESIRVRLGGGGDFLKVQLASGGVLGLRKLSVSLGSGDDFADLTVDPAVELSVSGGSGEDAVRALGPIDAVRSVEQVTTAVALAPGGGGSLGYTCSGTTPDGKTECMCDARDDWDCFIMYFNECAPGQWEDFKRCIEGSITTHCTCKKAAILRPDLPIFQPIDDGVLIR
jgi:hypothetical protein